jgi:hypothetical protein
VAANEQLAHGDSDTSVPIEQGRDMFDAMRRAHKDVQLVVLKGEGSLVVTQSDASANAAELSSIPASAESSRLNVIRVPRAVDPSGLPILTRRLCNWRTCRQLTSNERSVIVEAIGLYRSVNSVQMDRRFWFEYGHPALHRRELGVFFDLSVFSPIAVVIDQNLERYFIS